MRVLMFPLGSSGDVHPFIGLGAALQERGHDVTLFGNAHFTLMVERSGLKHVELSDAAEYEALSDNPDLWDPKKSSQAIFGNPSMERGIRRQFEAVRQNLAPGNTVVVHGCLAMGPRIAREVMEFPLVTVHLQPMIFASSYSPPRYAHVSLPRWAPPWVLRQIYRFGNWAIADPMLAKCIEPLRRELGLPRARQYAMGWWNSPDRVIGLFPEWYASPAPDWPPQTRLTGFPRFDERTIRTLDPKVIDFLDRGNPPVVFTFGSAMKFARPVFEVAVRALQAIDRRGVFLTSYAAQIPDNLPESIVHFDYVPLSQILLRSSALVHHGGIGTTAQALAAGVPQLVVPFAHDQPDNAERLRKLGVARELPPKNLTVRNLMRELEELLHDDEVKADVAACQMRFADDRSVDETCDLIEQALKPVFERPAIADR